MRNDLVFLLRHSVPVPGEQAACLESWRNVLAPHFMPRELELELESSREIWSAYRREGAAR